MPRATNNSQDGPLMFTDVWLMTISATLSNFFVLLFQLKDLDSPKCIAIRLPKRLSCLKDDLLYDRLYNISGLNLCDDTAVHEPLPMFAIENSDSFYDIDVPFLNVASFKEYLNSNEDRLLVHYRGRISDKLSDKHGIYEMDGGIILVSPLQYLTNGLTITCYNCTLVNNVKSVFLVANTHSYFKKNSRKSKFIEPKVAGIEEWSLKLKRAVILKHLHKIKPLQKHLDLICNVLLPNKILVESSDKYFNDFIKSSGNNLKIDAGSVQTILTISEIKNGAKWSSERVVIVLSVIVNGKVHFLDESGQIETICLNAVQVKPNCVYKLSEFSLHMEKYIVIDEEQVELVWDYGYAEFREGNSTHQYTILISEKNHTIRNNKFICRTDPDCGDLCDATLCISSNWFSYICPGCSYVLSTNTVLTEKLLVLDESKFNFQLCSDEELGQTTDNDWELSGRRGCDEFNSFDKMLDNTLVNLCGEIININSQYISVRNSSSEIINIGLNLAVSRVLPNGLSPGVTISLQKLLVKVSAQGKRYIHVTTLTSISVTSVTPRAHNSAIIVPILQLIYPSQLIESVPQKTNKIISIRGICDTILSFSSSLDMMSCKLSLSDLTGSCNVYIDQTSLLRTLFNLTDTDVELIRSAGNITYGRHHAGSVVSSEVQQILTRPLTHHQMLLIQGKVHRGKSAYLVKTEFGQTLKHHNMTLYPLSVERLSVKDLVMDLSNSEE